MGDQSCTNPDWDAIRSEYITTAISYRKLAAARGVSFRTLADRANREGWADARDKYRNNRVTKTVQKVAAQSAADTASKLIKIQRAADRLCEVVEGVLSDTETFKSHVVTEEKFDTKAIKDLAVALKDLAAVIRNVNDLPTMQEQTAMELAAQRLALDKAKADMGRPEDDETGVVEIAPLVEDENA